MSMFKYETIQIVSDSSACSSSDRSKLKERERSATYAKGFKDGVNVTKNSIEIEKTKLLAQLNEKLSDLDITNELATVTVMKSLHPLIRLNWVGGYDQLDWSSAGQIVSRVFDDYMKAIDEDKHERRRHTGR